MADPLDVQGNISLVLFFDDEGIASGPEDMREFRDFFQAMRESNDPFEILVSCEENDMQEGRPFGSSLEQYLAERRGTTRRGK